MNKRELFLKVIASGEYRRRLWVISAFAVVDQSSSSIEKTPYKIIKQTDGYYFIDPENNLELTKIDDADISESVFKIKEKITLNPGDLPNVFETIETNYGTALINALVLCYPFKNKVKYINERFSAKKLESLIVDRIVDNPKDSYEVRSDELIYVDEYLKFTDAMFSLVAYTQLCVPAHTEKSLIECPGIKELRDRLLEKYKDRLHDPATIAVIDAELIKFYKEWIKDDDSMGFLISKKSIEIVRKKLFMMHGAEMGLEENVDVTLIKNSLSEGWDVKAFPAMNNSLRAGSFNRGQQTELGGVAFKELLRASSNLRIVNWDCRSKLGVDIKATDGEEHKLIGFTVINSDGSQNKIDKDNVGKYLMKAVKLRSPLYCLLDKTDYCSVCMGDRLSSNPTGLPTVVSDYGSTFLSIFMAAAHAKGLNLAKMNYKTAIQ